MEDSIVGLQSPQTSGNVMVEYLNQGGTETNSFSSDDVGWKEWAVRRSKGLCEDDDKKGHGTGFFRVVAFSAALFLLAGTHVHVWQPARLDSRPADHFHHLSKVRGVRGS